MASLGELLGRLDPDPYQRGKQFERICQWFLRNNPVHAAMLRVDRIWLWDEWPGRWGADDGIDLVAETIDGHLWAIQAKAYAPTTSITKTDVDSFLSASGRPQFSFRLLIATTDEMGFKATATIDEQEKQARVLLRADLEEFDIEWPDSPDDVRAPRPLPKEALPHQREAIDNVVAGFGQTDRGQLLMACGTGKTLTALFVKEELVVQRTLVLLPSLSLLGQTVREWVANKKVHFEFLPVCSDKTVTDPDGAVVHTSDLSFPVTTDSDEIVEFLQRPGPRVVFATYQSSPEVARAMTRDDVPSFDLVIADEAHRCAGPVSSAFGTVLDRHAIRAHRRLFMTATPRVFTGRVIREAREAEFEIASMDNAALFGAVFHRLGFAEAIRRGRLTDYQVAVVGVDNPTYRRWAERGRFVTRDGVAVTSARTLAGQIGVAKAMHRFNLRRTITFHSRVKSAREFAQSLPDVIAWMPADERPSGTIWTDYAAGEMSARQRQVRLQHLGKLAGDERGLLANARCLGEGVDVPTLDGVAFVDPRRSEVDIVQAVGRAIRLAPDKTLGTIVIPVFVDVDENPDIALDRSSFKPVWDVIRALRSHDEHLGEELDELRRELGRSGRLSRLPGKIHLDFPETVSADFIRAFDVRLVEQTSVTWESWFGLLQLFVQQNGNARVPQSYKATDRKLGHWVARQRAAYAEGSLDATRRDRLEGVPGWTWTARVERWEEGYAQLIAYADRHGHARVPQSFEADGYKLGSWVRQQRGALTDGSLDDDRRRRLDDVPGWSWDARVDRWEEGFERLLNYVDEFGHARVSRTATIMGYHLGKWVKIQQGANRQGWLEPDRKRRLEALPGWSWYPHADRWQDGYAHLLAFANEHGHTRIPQSHIVNGHRLGAWVSQQRLAFAKDKLDTDRQHQLEKLPGWIWDSRVDQWDQHFAQLLSYIKSHGHARVAQGYTVNDLKLGNWVQTQRRAFLDGSLDPDRQRQLNDLAEWSWNARADRWEEAYARLAAFVQEHGHSRVPQSFKVDGFKLGSWVGEQRNTFAKAAMDPVRRSRLEELPAWSWDPHADQWEEAYRRLVQYTNEHGHARVPVAYEVDGFRLGTWVRNQRKRASTDDPVAVSRRQRLEDLPGWNWTYR